MCATCTTQLIPLESINLNVTQRQRQRHIATDSQSVSKSWCRAQFGTFNLSKRYWSAIETRSSALKSNFRPLTVEIGIKVRHWEHKVLPLSLFPFSSAPCSETPFLYVPSWIRETYMNKRYTEILFIFSYFVPSCIRHRTPRTLKWMVASYPWIECAFWSTFHISKEGLCNIRAAYVSVCERVDWYL
jgi:hypothetical protein